ncbi:MAG: exodeoxyribonuclease large subunit, partial [Pseudonocardiales bacterium]|nr:exodeoxyribonuclease large subunit [Pseudonocardiales bacterium]
MARLETSADKPVPVRVVAQRIGEWIARLGEIWIDGQIAQVT